MKIDVEKKTIVMYVVLLFLLFIMCQLITGITITEDVSFRDNTNRGISGDSYIGEFLKNIGALEEDYSLLEAFSAECENSFDLIISLPSYYGDVRIIKCRGKDCYPEEIERRRVTNIETVGEEASFPVAGSASYIPAPTTPSVIINSPEKGEVVSTSDVLLSWNILNGDEMWVYGSNSIEGIGDNILYHDSLPEDGEHSYKWKLGDFEDDTNKIIVLKFDDPGGERTDVIKDFSIYGDDVVCESSESCPYLRAGEGKSGGAARFYNGEERGYCDGEPDNDCFYIVRKNERHSLSDVTVAAWVYLDSSFNEAHDDFTIVSFGLTDSHWNFLVNNDPGYDGHLRYLCELAGRSNFYYHYDSTTNFADEYADQWAHVVMTKDDNYVRFYINGKLSDTVPTREKCKGVIVPAHDIYIGGQKGEMEGWNGYIDELIVWKRSLTAGEINALYRGSERYYWRVDLSSGTDVISSGNYYFDRGSPTLGYITGGAVTSNDYGVNLVEVSAEEKKIDIKSFEDLMEKGGEFYGEFFDGLTEKLYPDDRERGLKSISEIVLEASDIKDSLVKLQYAVDENVYEDSIALFAWRNGKWDFIGNELDKESRTVSAPIDVSQFKDIDGNVRLAVKGVLVGEYIDASFKRLYEPEKPSRDAVILVHGLGSTHETFKYLLKDIEEAKQPFQVWAFDYSSKRYVGEIADELSDLIESNIDKYDRIFIVGHSLGGIIAQQALRNGYEKDYSYIDKVKKAILIGAPNEGSVVAEAYDYLFSTLVGRATGVHDVFNINENFVKDLTEGRIVERVPGVDYYVIAGIGKYTEGLAGVISQRVDPSVKFDGIVSTKSAQNIGGEYVNDMCENYWEVGMTHMELIDDAASRQIIGNIISEEVLKAKEEAISLGNYRYYKIRIDECSPDTHYLTVGRKIAEEGESIAGCKCGDGLCGGGENMVNCPADCANFLAQKGGKLFLVVGVVVLGILLFVIFRFRKNREAVL